MTRIEAKGIGKRYFHQWILKDISFSLENGEQLLITGPNGSGKSTLLRILAGQLTPTRGEIQLQNQGKIIPPHLFYKYLAWTGPYFDLYTDLTLREAVNLHFRFKPLLLPSNEDVIRRLRLEKDANKQLRQFSSGMLHRLKVGLCIYSDVPLLFLDEASTNLDETNTQFIFEELEEFQKDRLLIFVSNNNPEFSRFGRRLDLG
ncbi:MAG: ATP-binding cassette domain-containing protein [Bacteroidia bacterium]|nr:ATP-binding cassette domain-containing protein [Bacteroidia bacterium]